MSATITFDLNAPRHRIHPNIYGHFAEHLGRCIYDGIWVGENSTIPNVRGIRTDVLEALKQIRVPVLRWPGGCFADEYHWRDGIGPRERRPKTINTHWGMVTETNEFGTHEFMDLCELLGCEAYIAGNLGSGSVAEMAQWVEYMTAREGSLAEERRRNGRDQPWVIQHFGVGNESWGCGGNMTADYYVNEFRRYSGYVRDFPGQRISHICCGANDFNFDWTRKMMERALPLMHGLSLHYYVLPTGNWSAKGSATEFGEDQYFSTMQRALRMDGLLQKHSEIMDVTDPKRRVGLCVDEWGVWCDPEPGTNPSFLYQQNSMRDALLAATTLNIFHQHAERVTMANIAQMVNVLQAMLLTDGPRLLKTPTYHVFDLYQSHQGAAYIPCQIAGPEYRFGNESIPAISASASAAVDGTITLSLVNIDPANPAMMKIYGLDQAAVKSARQLTAKRFNACNTFDRPDEIVSAPFSEYRVTPTAFQVQLPPLSIVVLQLDS